MNLKSYGKLLPIGGGFVLILVLVVLSKSCGSSSGPTGHLLEQVPDTPLPDADTPADTIKTLTAAVSALTMEVEALHKDNSDIRQSTREFKQRIGRLQQDVETEIAFQMARLDLEDHLETLPATQQMNLIQEEIAELKSQIQQTDTAGIPPGLGYDDVTLVQPFTTQYEWTAAGTDMSAALPHAVEHGGTTERPSTSPMFTLPENATLVNAKLMTAMIGRVPKENEVVDAMPFKVITGDENLAANGMEIQGIKGMVWSGTAVGDWTLSCVAGRLQSVTLIFDDGTIHTSNMETVGTSALGWLSDEFGLPCIPGERKTNVSAYLTANVLSQSASAAANAVAAAETSRLTNSFGQTNTTITGDLPTYLLGRTAAGGANSMASWLADRRDQEFDAVVVAAGSLVAIHIQTEIPIDFDPQGRKLTYEQTLNDAHHAPLD